MGKSASAGMSGRSTDLVSSASVAYEILRCPLTLKDIRDLFFVRALLESAAAETAARQATEVELVEIAQLARAATYGESDCETIRQFLEMNTRFHIAVAVASRNRKFVRILSEVLQESDRMFYFGLTSKNRSIEMLHEHNELVDALSNRDPAAAKAAVIKQLRTAEQMVVDAFMIENLLLGNDDLTG
jgi:DNA-binding GntR family transcriptional regulator